MFLDNLEAASNTKRLWDLGFKSLPWSSAQMGAAGIPCLCWTTPSVNYLYSSGAWNSLSTFTQISFEPQSPCDGTELELFLVFIQGEVHLLTYHWSCWKQSTDLYTLSSYCSQSTERTKGLTWVRRQVFPSSLLFQLLALVYSSAQHPQSIPQPVFLAFSHLKLIIFHFELSLSSRHLGHYSFKHDWLSFY